MRYRHSIILTIAKESMEARVWKGSGCEYNELGDYTDLNAAASNPLSNSHLPPYPHRGKQYSPHPGGAK